MGRVLAVLERRSTVYIASLVSLALGLFFIFVRSPLPWGWQGIDGYDTFALALADGKPFPTIHVSWGYAYFLAFFYRLFGNRPEIPLSVQALFNAAVPLMLYHLVRLEMDERTAVLTALLAGLLSFNTVYVSTQTSDPMCTVIVVAAMLSFALGVHRRRTVYFVVAGGLIGLSYQFRPNLVLFPVFLAAMYVFQLRRQRALAAGRGQVMLFLATFLLAAAPWVVRNYFWTEGLFVPATTHGGVQLWFGTLQTGLYRDSWLYNPRAGFEFPPVDYSSIDELPVVVTGVARACPDAKLPPIDLVYWTNRDATPRRTPVAADADGRFSVRVPTQPTSTAIHYYFESAAVRMPPAGAADPLTIVVSRDHLGDLDVDGSRLDVFDVVRMARHVAWAEPLPDPARVDFNADGSITDADVRRAASLVIDNSSEQSRVPDATTDLKRDDTAVTISFKDSSSIAIPHRWSGKITDVELRTTGVVAASTAALLVSHSRSFASLTAGPLGPSPCPWIADVGANRVLYRRFPHEMRRFIALSMDNIRQAPVAYLFASALRAVRVFIISGSDDPRTASQFEGGGRVYTIGRVASTFLFVLFLAGVCIAWRNGFRLWLLLGPIVYLAVTICFVLINARYSMTMQPFMFAFVAVAIATALDAMQEADRPIAAQSR